MTLLEVAEMFLELLDEKPVIIKKMTPEELAEWKRIGQQVRESFRLLLLGDIKEDPNLDSGEYRIEVDPSLRDLVARAIDDYKWAKKTETEFHEKCDEMDKDMRKAKGK